MNTGPVTGLSFWGNPNFTSVGLFFRRGELRENEVRTVYY